MNAPDSPAPGQHLSKRQLGLLLADSELEVIGGITRHLDDCDSCQSLLTRLAADNSWWGEAQSMLNGEHGPAWDVDLTFAYPGTEDGEHSQSQLQATLSGLLSEPSHPEMLGRLGRYDIERIIGSGGMGIVLKAHDTELNRPIALKLLAPHLAHVGAARERFAREGRAAAAVVHEHVVAIHNVESDGQSPFLVMQYVPGRSLQARVDEDGPLAVEEILRIGMQAAGGLAAAHKQGLVHRDVKPANILLENGVERAILTDFGLARAIDDASLTQTGALAGTPHYMSPEQAGGDVIDCRSDLFSLGAVLYFMATGHPPFRAAGAMAVLQRLRHEKHRSVRRSNTTIPVALSEVIDRLLEKKPSRRPSTADEVQHQLATLLSSLQQGRSPRFAFAWPATRVARMAKRIVFGILATTSVVIAVFLLKTPPSDQVDRREYDNPFTEPFDRGVEMEHEGMFVRDLTETNIRLEQLESKTRFVQYGDPNWNEAVAQLEQELTRLEALNAPSQSHLEEY